MFIDVENVNINELVREKKVGTILEKIRVTPRGSRRTNFIFDSAKKELFDYTISDSTGALTVTIKEDTVLPTKGIATSSRAEQEVAPWIFCRQNSRFPHW